MTRRLLPLLVLVAVASALAATAQASTGRAAATTPDPKAMVLGKEDFPAGTLLVYQGKKVPPVFAPIVANVALASSYSRTLSDVSFQSADFPQVFSFAFVARNEAELAQVMQGLAAATVPGSGRRMFVEGMKSGSGKGVTTSLTRARQLKLGDTTVELVVHFKYPAAEFDLTQLWIRIGKSVSAVAVISDRPPTAGQTFALAKVVAGHLKRATA